MKKKLMIWLLMLVGSLTSCVTYVTDCSYTEGNQPLLLEFKTTKVFENNVNGITIWRLDTPVYMKYTDRKAIEDISGIFAVTKVHGLPYSVYFSTYKISDISDIENEIGHYIHYKALRNLKSWVIPQQALTK